MAKKKALATKQHLNQEEVQKIIDLLFRIKNDPQFDPNHEWYCGFLTIGIEENGEGIGFEGEYLRENGWLTFLENPHVFLPLLRAIGLDTEYLNEEETTFTQPGTPYHERAKKEFGWCS